MTKDSDEKHTNEKPVKIPLSYKETLNALLKVKPKPQEKKPKKPSK